MSLPLDDRGVEVKKGIEPLLPDYETGVLAVRRLDHHIRDASAVYANRWRDAFPSLCSGVYYHVHALSLDHQHHGTCNIDKWLFF